MVVVIVAVVSSGAVGVVGSSGDGGPAPLLSISPSFLLLSSLLSPSLYMTMKRGPSRRRKRRGLLSLSAFS